MAITLNGTTITMNDASTLVSTTTHLAIGSYATLAIAQNGTSLAAGQTTAGTSLRYNTGSKVQGFAATLGSQVGVSVTGTGTAASGTWRSMDGSTNNSLGQTHEGVTTYYSSPCLCARVS